MPNFMGYGGHVVFTVCAVDVSEHCHDDEWFICALSHTVCDDK